MTANRARMKGLPSMSMEGLPMRKIAWTQVVVIVALLGVAVVALITDNKDVGNVIIGAIVGSVFGAGATTVIVAANNGKTKPNDPTSAP